MMYTAVLLFACCSFLANASLRGNAGTFQFVEPVTALELKSYMGLWYQMYADAFVTKTFEKNNYCVTAMYGSNSDGTVSVHNYATLSSATGDVSTIDGYAYMPDASQPGKLKVHFTSNSASSLFDAPYWIISLGPLNSEGLYDYAIVSDNIDFSLFVLARDVTVFRTKYESDVLNQLKSFGFSGLKAPVKTYQDVDCKYEADVRRSEMAMSAVIEKQYKATL